MALEFPGFDTLTKEQLLSMARISESSERYEDMTKFMKKLVQVVTATADLTVEERNLLSVAYKNVVGARRASWRTLSVDENKDLEPVVIFRKQIEKELSAICSEVLSLLKDQLVKAAERAGDVEAQVFYLKMAGDYYRYFAEFQPSDEHAKSAQSNYERAYKLAVDGSGDKAGLLPTHPIRLGLALNYSVCFYEILKNPDEACKLAKKAFDDAVAKLEGLNETEYKDSTLIMQLLRDNLTLWTQDAHGDGDE